MNAYGGQVDDDPEVQSILIYHIFGTTYGWTPEEVDRIPVRVVMALLELILEGSSARETFNRLMSRVV